jgi:methionyl-tRNA formyltransferase
MQKYINMFSKKSKGYLISFTCDEKSWINPFIIKIKNELERDGHVVNISHCIDGISSGDFNFILSFSKIIPKNILCINRHNLVVHESALPAGRGWSPLTWQILEGKNTIPITLFEAEEALDSGKIYLQGIMKFIGDELVDELRLVQGEATISLCRRFIQEYPDVIKLAQNQVGSSSFYRRRTPEDSKLDPSKTIAGQFNLLRVADNSRYPAFFEFMGIRYELQIKKS